MAYDYTLVITYPTHEEIITGNDKEALQQRAQEVQTQFAGVRTSIVDNNK